MHTFTHGCKNISLTLQSVFLPFLHLEKKISLCDLNLDLCPVTLAQRTGMKSFSRDYLAMEMIALLIAPPFVQFFSTDSCEQ